MRLALVLCFLLSTAFAPACTTAPPARGRVLSDGAAAPALPTTVRGEARLKDGRIAYELFLPATLQPAPLVLVAHGFTRKRGHMTGWGRRLSEEGFVAVVPQLPSWFDNHQNARVINDLIPWLLANAPEAARMDQRRIGLMGLSAGGLTTLLAAADNPSVKIWVGLDPVDHADMGAAAAPRYRGAATILRATPSAWNGNGNAAAIEKALPPGWKDIEIPNSVHIDAEWPTDVFAQLAIGISSDTARAEFARHAVEALKTTLRPPAVPQTAELSGGAVPAAPGPVRTP